MRGVRYGQVNVSSAPSQWVISRRAVQADRDGGRADRGLTSAECEQLLRLRRDTSRRWLSHLVSRFALC